MTALTARASQRQKQVPQVYVPPTSWPLLHRLVQAAKAEKSRRDAGATKIDGLVTSASPAFLARVVPLSRPKRRPYKLLPRDFTEHHLPIYAFSGMATVRC
jgi:hypothetical protein